MAAYRRIPILLCGRQEAIGTVVINALKPEYEGMLTNNVRPFIPGIFVGLTT